MTEDPYPPPPPGPPPPGPPPPDPPPTEPVRSPIPWEDRARLGFFPALVENVKLFVTAPQEGYRRMLQKGDYASPLLFAILLGWVGTAFSYFWSLLIGSGTMMMIPGLPKEELGLSMLLQGGASIFALILAPVFICIILFIGSGILHLCLLLVKGTDHSQAGFEGTLRVLSYAAVAQLAQIVPMAGGLIAFVWALILYVIGFTTVHRTTQGKAILAIVIPIILCCVCAVAAIALVAAGFGGLAAAAGGASGS